MTALPISLGLQGGGAYGAFTWGVLDRLLDDQRLVFDAIGEIFQQGKVGGRSV